MSDSYVAPEIHLCSRQPFKPIFVTMEADPYSCYYMEKNGYRLCIMKLRTIPNDIVQYVTKRAPNIDSFDWWWMPKSNEKENWTELTIRANIVIDLEKI